MTESLVEERFNAAVAIVHNLPEKGDVSTSNTEKLTFYSLYKQAILGPCTKPSPAFWNVIEKYKWEAWSSLGDMSREVAMEAYVKKIQDKIDSVIEKSNISQWLEGPDYERLESVLRERFRLIDRELDTDILTERARPRRGPANLAAVTLSIVMQSGNARVSPGRVAIDIDESGDTLRYN